MLLDHSQPHAKLQTRHENVEIIMTITTFLGPLKYAKSKSLNHPNEKKLTAP